MPKGKIIFAILLCILFFKIKAQQDPKAETKRLVALSEKLAGTYQLQIIDSREKIAMPFSLLDTIQAKRHPNQVTYFWFRNNVRVKVLPFSVINQGGYTPLERVVNVSSKNLTD